MLEILLDQTHGCPCTAPAWLHVDSPTLEGWDCISRHAANEPDSGEVLHDAGIDGDQFDAQAAKFEAVAARDEELSAGFEESVANTTAANNTPVGGEVCNLEIQALPRRQTRRTLASSKKNNP